MVGCLIKQVDEWKKCGRAGWMVCGWVVPLVAWFAVWTARFSVHAWLLNDLPNLPAADKGTDLLKDRRA